MTEDNTIEVKNDYKHLIVEERNKHTIYCTKCPSKMLSSTMGKHIKIDVILFIIHSANLVKCNINFFLYII